MSNAPFVAGRIAPLSVLELATVQEGQSAEAGLAAVTAVARRADELGFRRMWLAEHHGFRSVGSVAPAVLTAHLAANTARIRLGSGGVLLTHHAPLVVAEQFTTLSALHPGRIDLGIGRGPGTKDERMLRALRNTQDAAAQNFDAALEELLDLLTDDAPHRVLPGTGNTHPEPWLLSTSITGARLAAMTSSPGAHTGWPAPTATSTFPRPSAAASCSRLRTASSRCSSSSTSPTRKRTPSKATAKSSLH